MTAPNLSELVTSTLRRRSGKAVNNWTGSQALIKRLKAQGKVKPVSGGRTIVEEIVYQDSGNYKRYQGGETLNIDPRDHLTGAEFQWKQAAVAVQTTGLETEVMNTGKEQVVDLLESRIENAFETLYKNTNADMYSDGTADDGKQIGGLQAIVSDTGSGSLGGIDSSTWTFWQNQYESLTNVSPTTIKRAMQKLHSKLVMGSDKPDLAMADNEMFDAYDLSLQELQRIAKEDDAAAGFTTLRYRNMPVVLDGGINGDAPSNRMYFLNTKYLAWRPAKNRNFVPIGGDRQSNNQDATVNLFGWAGNMTCSSRRMQGVITI